MIRKLTIMAIFATNIFMISDSHALTFSDVKTKLVSGYETLSDAVNSANSLANGKDHFYGVGGSPVIYIPILNKTIGKQVPDPLILGATLFVHGEYI